MSSVKKTTQPYDGCTRRRGNNGARRWCLSLTLLYFLFRSRENVINIYVDGDDPEEKNKNSDIVDNEVLHVLCMVLVPLDGQQEGWWGGLDWLDVDCGWNN